MRKSNLLSLGALQLKRMETEAFDAFLYCTYLYIINYIAMLMNTDLFWVIFACFHFLQEGRVEVTLPRYTLSLLPLSFSKPVVFSNSAYWELK